MGNMRTCFKRVDYTLDALLHYIDIGDIGLPDIQRPFVWSNSKVRDLFDSMYRGFPVGYLLFWENAAVPNTKAIGIELKSHRVPNRLIVDGQQRLTSLFAVFRGKKVLDENYQERQIEIAFRPRDGTFEVADAAIRRDPEFIPTISALWSSGKPVYKIIKEFLQNPAFKTPITDDEEELISHNLDHLFDLQKYPFTVLEIAPTVDEEQVADIFVRINSEGVKLNQADFILTLLSVFWEEGRRDLEHFCRNSRIPPGPSSPPSPFNRFIQPSPDQLLRVAVALGFFRGKLKSTYQILRGKNLETGQFSIEERDRQFAILSETQEKVLNLTNWHQFLGALVGAGFRSGEQISSEITLVYAYAFYLIGKIRYGLSEFPLQRLIGRWFFVTSLTRRYTDSPESSVEQDLNRLKDLLGGEEFVAVLNKVIGGSLTPDFWTIALPNALETSAAVSPSLFAYYAAQNKLGSPALFSRKLIHELLDPTIKTKRKPLERHHLFPRAYLDAQGIKDQKLINQAANYALLEWPENLEISDQPPSTYVPMMRERFKPEEWARMCRLHALPDGWEHMAYERFLQERRVLMAQVIKEGFETLE